MIYIVHGNDYSKSRKLIINQKTKVGAEHIDEKEIEDITPRELYENLVSFDLFGNAPFIILKIPARKVANVEEYLSVIEKTPEKSVLIILAATKLGKTNDFLKNAKKLKAKIAFNEVLVESNIFNFVDNLFYKDRRETYKELKKLEAEDNDPFYIFSMILYGLRNITQAKFKTKEFEKKSGYMREKIIRQAENFTQDEILNLYDKIYQIDKMLKTGKIDKSFAISYTIEATLNQ